MVDPNSGYAFSHHESKTYAQYQGDQHYHHHHPQNQQYLIKSQNPFNSLPAHFNPQSKRRYNYLYDQNVVIRGENAMSGTELSRKILDRKDNEREDAALEDTVEYQPMVYSSYTGHNKLQLLRMEYHNNLIKEQEIYISYIFFSYVDSHINVFRVLHIPYIKLINSFF